MRTSAGTSDREPSQRSGLRAGAVAVPLIGVDVRAEVMGGYARATVRQRYRNDETKPIEAIYTFPLPTKGSVTGFAMSVEGRQLVGEVHEREEAFRRYDDAMSAGHGSALLEQERPNVFTANVGNLLPGEETIIEIEYVEPVHADEGAIRWSLPTLVAPRYMPGSPSGDRTGHGAADPTTRVPDADRISPPIGAAPYGLSLDLVLDMGCEVEVESPSHDIRFERLDGVTPRSRVTFVQREVALDRDIVITAFPKHSAFDVAPLASVVAHRPKREAGGEPAVGAFALSLVPDLAGGLSRRDVQNDVVFVLDRSGSMEGSAMQEAKTALRLCLRQLREGDRFAIIAFDDSMETMARGMTKLSRSTLSAADRFIDGVDARGGTEMLQPLVAAVDLAPNGVIVLLTDGQVGNEAEIQEQLLVRRAKARVYSFGIGTNVSDALLVGLADKTGGAVEMIHPGERVDDKVVAQFARATAPRVTDLEIKFRGVDVGEIAPAEPTALIDGEPLSIFGTYEAGGVGAVEIRGTYDGERFYLEVPIDLPDEEERPAVAKLWAQARIHDLERASLSGRRADTMKQRIVDLAKKYGVSSKYTSFVVVEKRTGDRRVNEQAATRVVPVNAPAGWASLQQASRSRSYGSVMSAGVSIGAVPPPMAQAPRSMSIDASSVRSARRSVSPPVAPRPAAGMPMHAPAAMPPPAAARGGSSAAYSAGPPSPPPAPSRRSAPPARVMREMLAERDDGFASAEDPSMLPDFADDTTNEVAELGAAKGGPADPLLTTLGRQSSSGLWESQGRDPIEVTVDALLVLLRLGVSTSHPVHGAQTKKAVDALLDALGRAPSLDPKLAELALAALWLLSTGRRTRTAIKDATGARLGLEGLAAILGRDDDVRAHVERMAPMC